jgi:hypothetical protein
MLERVYGLSPSSIVTLESWLKDNLRDVACVFNHPTLNWIANIDCPIKGSIVRLAAWYNDVVGPILEEVCKHRWSIATPVIVGMEAFAHVLTGGVTGLARYIPTAIMHRVAAQLPLPLACAIHIAWNLVSV